MNPHVFFSIMLFIIGLPVLQIILFCLSIGKDPMGLRIAINNNELNNSMMPCVPSTGCDWTRLSCRFLQHLEDRSIVLLPYDSDADAKNAVERGWAWAAITFPANYSDSLSARIEEGKDADDWSVTFSNMQVTMDMSSECNSLSLYGIMGPLMSLWPHGPSYGVSSK